MRGMSLSTLVFTAHDKAYAELAAITVPRMQSYAKRHGYEFICYTEPLADIPNAIYWSGVLGAVHNLEKYDRVMYLDVDQLITNPDLPVDYLIPFVTTGFHASWDWGIDATEPWQFSMCGWVAHQDCIPIFQEAFRVEPEWRNRPFPEQGPMQYGAEMVMTGVALMHDELLDFRDLIEPYKGLYTIHPRRTFNAVPEQVSPGNVPEPWQLGDFAAHLTMLSIDDRIKLAKEIYEKTKPMG